MPNVVVTPKRAPRRLSDSEDEESATIEKDIIIPSLGLVATRPLCDEEILLNYRLSIHVDKPSWYVPVDLAEDKRRWA